VKVRAGGTASGAHDSDNRALPVHRSLLGVDLTEVTIEAAEVAIIDDDIVAVAGVAMVYGSNPAREHAIDQTVSESQVYAVMECAALGKGVLAVAIRRGNVK
jgi:hypothetical protein